MENFEGGSSPEIKDKEPTTKKLSLRKRLKLAAAVIVGTSLGPDIQGIQDRVSSTSKIPDEIRPPEPLVAVSSQPTPAPKNI